jgi:hypothetical protein
VEDYIAAVAQRRAAFGAPTLRIVQPTVVLRQPVARPRLTPPVLRLPEVITAPPSHSSFFQRHFQTDSPNRFNVAWAGIYAG